MPRLTHLQLRYGERGGVSPLILHVKLFDLGAFVEYRVIRHGYIVSTPNH
jgi:hypothetical protein